jgi:hypothetical protein
MGLDGRHGHGGAVLLRLITLAVPVLLLLSACGSDEAPAADDPETALPAPDSETRPPGTEEVARAFVDVLDGHAHDELWSGPVALYVAGTLSSTLTPADAADPTRWAGCPGDVATYNERECPVSLPRTIQALRSEGGTLVFEDQVPAIMGCDRVRPPPGVDGLDSVTVRPGVAHRSCFSDFAMTLYVDDRGQVGTVSVTISGP